ncbi:hypothetical protein NESM_000418500 [Novymonas esmeraldas]|uniref:Uncharacterized protein n=1 Tax=Novymonas esmeraldas TaxID=1808958 RepID=A0AAW0EPS8_9TRYP
MPHSHPVHRTTPSTLTPARNGSVPNHTAAPTSNHSVFDERRRNTTPATGHLSSVVVHTPPPTASNSMDGVQVAPHALSEPCFSKPDLLVLSTLGGAGAATARQLPPLSGLLSSARTTTPTGASAAIARSARIPLGSPSTSPAASTPRMQPTPPTVSTAASASNYGAAPRPINARPPIAPAPPPPTRGETSEKAESTPATTTMQDALKFFNQRVQEENEREKARTNRRSSRTSSRESSMLLAPSPPATAASAANTNNSRASNGVPNGGAAPPSRAAVAPRVSPQASPPRGTSAAAGGAGGVSRSAPPTPAAHTNASAKGGAGAAASASTSAATEAAAAAAAASPPLVAQGPRSGLPRSMRPEQRQQLVPARQPPPPSPPRTETSAPPVASAPSPSKTGAARPHIAAARLPPPPRASSAAAVTPHHRYPPVDDDDDAHQQQRSTSHQHQQKQQQQQPEQSRPAAGKPVAAAAPPTQLPRPTQLSSSSSPVNPVYSAVEVQESASLSGGSSGGRWSVLVDSRRPSQPGSLGNGLSQERNPATGASVSGPTTAAAAATLPGLRKSRNLDELDDVGEEATPRQSSIFTHRPTTGILPPVSPDATHRPPSLGRHVTAANGGTPSAPGAADDCSSGSGGGGGGGAPQRLSDAGAAEGSPLTALPIFSSTDERPGKASPTNTAVKKDAATAAATAKALRQSPPAASPTKAAGPLADGVGAAQGPDSALHHTGRYTPARVNGASSHPASVDGSAPDADAELAALNSYLKEEDLNLSMSTFNSVGPTLAQSLTLRVLNLKGSTIASEGLRGLADIPTLRSICVSHMRNLTTLVPLVTPTARAGGRPCGIEEIDAQFSSVSNEGIWGLERLRRLRRLDLGMTTVSDVTCLAASHSINDLYLTGTRVDSPGLAGLERLPTLALLNVARTKVTSLRQLARSRSIQTLIAYSCQVTDDGFIGVGEMPRLSTLDVSTTKITNLSVLQKSRSLKSLRAQWLSLKNCHDIIQQRRAQLDGATPDTSMAWRDTEAGFAGLASIPTLESVDLSFNTIRSFHSLCRSKSLKHLVLRRTRVDNGGIGSIAQLASTLETLVLTNLTDILDESDDTEASGASNAASGLLSSMGDLNLLRRLTSIDLSFTDVYDLRLLQELRGLRELIIVETLVTVDGLRGIEKIATLETLDISQTSIISLQFLVGGAPALKKVLVKSNRNVRGFKLGRVDQLRALEHLDVSDTVVEDIESVLKATWRLKTLVWRWKERRDNKGPAPALECWVTAPRLAGVNAMPCLATLDLTNSSVHDLNFLERSTSLTTVLLKCCRLLRNSTIKGLGTLPALEVLELTDNRRISDVTCLRSCRRLRELRLNHTHVTKAGLDGVTDLPELKVLDIANTRAEDDVKDEDVNGAVERSRLLEDSNMRDCSTLLDSSAAPAQFRVPRRRRVSFIANDGGEAAPSSPS